MTRPVTDYGYATATIVRAMRNKSGWLAFLWALLALRYLSNFTESLLDQSWLSVLWYGAIVFMAAVLAWGEVGDWRRFDRLLGGPR